MSTLSSVTKGKIQSPITVVMHGSEGVGKSSFPMSAPAPIYIPTEDGTNELDIVRFPRPKTWAELGSYVNDLATEAHNYKTVVIDTLDGAEPLCWQHVIDAANAASKDKKIDSIEGIPYGKGYVAAVEAWRGLRSGLDRIKAKGINVVLLAHSVVKNFKSPDPSIEPFHRYEMKLNGQAAALWKEWPDCVLFANHEILSTETEDKRVVGVSSGRRIMRTMHTAAWDAKNRYNLPDPLPLSWAEFEKAVNAGRSTSQSSLVDEIRVLAEKAPEDVKKQVPGIIERAGGDVNKLNQAKSWIASKIA